MVVGTVREQKTLERRVALTPAGVGALVARGHTVLVERGAGEGAGFDDEAYALVGATLVDRAATVWASSELLVKVKEPLPAEFSHLRRGLILFTYLHLAANPALTAALVESGCTAIAYETVKDERGQLPLLAPMSEIAGRLATQAAAHHLLATVGGPGMLLGGVPGVTPARVLVVGGGVAGTQAALVALGMGAEVTVLEQAPDRIRQLNAQLRGRARVLMSDAEVLATQLQGADAVVGAVLIPGALAPRLVTREMLSLMRAGRVIVDVAIDQGGCVESSRPTTHADPTYLVDGIIHYCVANMPGAVPVTATRALTQATLPYILSIADQAFAKAVASSPALASGVCVRDGRVERSEAARDNVSPDEVAPSALVPASAGAGPQ